MTPPVAVVTGGTRGIGRAITLALARSGARVYAIHARNREAAADLAREAESRGLDVRCLRADLTDEAASRAAVGRIREETDRVEVLVHSAASGVHREVTALSLKHLAWTFDVNVFAAHRFLLALLPLVPRGGRVVGITSQGGTRAVPNYAAIGASKGALESLFRHYAQALAPRGIAVNLVSPGLVMTDAVEAFPDKEQRTSDALARTPTGRLTTAEDVAGVVSFLCSPAAEQLVGQTIVLDGGRCLS